jgi:hypothetical protein
MPTPNLDANFGVGEDSYFDGIYPIICQHPLRFPVAYRAQSRIYLYRKRDIHTNGCERTGWGAERFVIDGQADLRFK